MCKRVRICFRESMHGLLLIVTIVRHDMVMNLIRIMMLMVMVMVVMMLMMKIRMKIRMMIMMMIVLVVVVEVMMKLMMTTVAIMIFMGARGRPVGRVLLEF